MKLLTTITILSLSVATLFGSPQHKQDTNLQKSIELAKSSSKLLLQTLSKNMKMHMKQGGVMDALEFCSQEAFTLTQKVNSQLQKGVEVKRISLKYRNPANAPTGNEIKVLESFDGLSKANVVLPKFLVEVVDVNTYKYYKPLVIKKGACLKCHGGISNNVALKKAIDDKYPADKATGYKMNDVRGAVVVTVKH